MFVSGLCLLTFKKLFFTSAKISLLYPISRNQCSLISLSALPGLDSFYRPSGWNVFYKAGPWFTALSHYFFACGYHNLDSALKWIVCYWLISSSIFFFCVHIPYDYLQHCRYNASSFLTDSLIKPTSNSRERLSRWVNIHMNAEVGSWVCLNDYWRKWTFLSLEMSEFLDAAAESGQSLTGDRRDGRHQGCKLTIGKEKTN